MRRKFGILFLVVLVSLFALTLQGKDKFSLKLKDSIIETNRQWSRVKLGVDGV